MTTHESEQIAVVRLRYGGNTYTIDPTKLSASDTMAVRTETGRPLKWWLALDEDETDLDQIAVLLWVGKRTAGEKVAGKPVPFPAVLESLTYGTFEDEVEILIDGDDDPEVDDPFDSSSGTSS